MKVTAKLVGYLVFGIVLLLAIDLYLAVQRESEALHADMSSDARDFGISMKEWVAVIWKTHGEEVALQMIEDTNREGASLRVRWIWLTDSSDALYQPEIASDLLQQMSTQDSFSWKHTNEDGKEMLYTYVMQVAGTSENDSRRGALEIRQPFDPVHQYTGSSIKRRIVMMAMIVLLATLTTGLLGMAIVGKPLQTLAEKAKRIGQGELDGPVELKGNDELTTLGNALNTMCEQLQEAKETLRKEHKKRIDAVEQLRHADRLRTVGELSSGLAHELGTPLNVISGRAGMIASERLNGPEVTKSAGIIRDQAERMTKIIQQLLDFARRRKPQYEALNLRSIVQQTIDLLTPLAAKREVTFRLLADKDCVTMVDIGQIQQVMTNLIVNAVHAAPSKSDVEIEIKQVRAFPPGGSMAAEKAYAYLAVRDSGDGIAKEDMSRLFEPFFTTKVAGEGSGLGLSIVQGIVQEHSGWVDVESHQEKGTQFTVYLPLEIPTCPDES